MPAPLADIDAEDFDRGIRTNIRGTFLGMKYQIPAMLRSGGGAIVNMASYAGLHGCANLAAYVAGKAGIIGLTKVAALDYADQGIRVNVVAPGPILTHHLEHAGEEARHLLPVPRYRLTAVSLPGSNLRGCIAKGNPWRGAVSARAMASRNASGRGADHLVGGDDPEAVCAAGVGRPIASTPV